MDPVSYLESLEASLVLYPEAQACVSEAKEAVSLLMWHELGEALLKAIRYEPVRAALFDIHQHVLLQTRADISPFVYAKLLLVLIQYAMVASSSPSFSYGSGNVISNNSSSSSSGNGGGGGGSGSGGNNSGNNTGNSEDSGLKQQGDLLTMLDSALASLSSLTPFDSSYSTLPLGSSAIQSQKCLQCLRALILMMKDEATVEARLIINRVSEYVLALQAHDIDPVLSALLAMARLREHELLREFDEYYEDAFKVYTCCVKAGILILPEELAILSYKTVVAALLSSKIYNFGQLLTFEPFVSSLRKKGAGQNIGNSNRSEEVGSSSSDSGNGNNGCGVGNDLTLDDNEWLLRWAQLCNDGDVAGFEKFTTDEKNKISTIPDLLDAFSSNLLSKKVRLMALLHLVFYTPSDKRVFTFKAVAARCKLDLNAVEPLLITAIANGLIKARIDGFKSEISISWVQPRVLSNNEIIELARLIGDWRKRVGEIAKDMGKMVEENQV